MPLAAGEKLGPYEIVAPLGAGGMGEVYRARDTRLKREVALKVLPAEVSRDPVRRQRFEQEARAVAALNHPNIVAIYDVGEENGVFFMVTELVDGEPLRGMKPPLRKTLDYAVQIATGLGAAHAAAITHRDLKPDNILLTVDGRIKILDFGLAKIHAPRSPEDATETLAVKTDPGVVMGTVGYMSPEQVRGQAADHRSDIFSFGLILYELLAGQRAFHGETAVETMNAILKHDPPDLPETVPSGVRQVVQHCLEKTAANRFQSARDLSFALGAMSSQSGTAPALPLPKLSHWLKRAAFAGAALALIALAAAGVALFSRAPETPVWSGGTLGGPEMALDPRPSPDGHLLAFQAVDRGMTQVAVMKPETGNWSILTHARERGVILEIAWSPDGALIYYDRVTGAAQGIYSVPVLGGDERLVLDDATLPEALPDGTLLVVKLNAQRRQQLYRFWPDTGRLQDLPVIVGHGGISGHPRAFPDGKRAVVSGAPLGREAEGAQLLIVDLAGGAPKPLLPAGKGFDSEAWAVARDGKSVAAAVVADALTRVVSIPIGGKSPIQTLFTAANLVFYLDTAPDGSVYTSLADRPAELVRRGVQGDHAERIATFPGMNESMHMIEVLPDGRVVVPVHASGSGRLMAVEKGKDPAPLLTTAEEAFGPLTAAGPHEIAFVIGPEPRKVIAVADTSSGRIARRISPGKGEVLSLASSPDGKTLYFAAGGAIWTVPSLGGAPRTVRAGDSVTADPSGRYLVIGVTEGSKFRLFRLPLDGGAEREITTDGSVPLMDWRLSPRALNADGRLLLPLQDAWFNAPGLLDTATGRLTRLPNDDSSDYHSMAWLPDGQIMTLHIGLRSTMWRFQPASK